MHRNKLACSILVLAVAGSMWACGSDDDSSVPGGAGAGAKAGAGGKSGSAGAGGKASGGSAGKASGGNAGKAGAPVGEGGEGGEPNGDAGMGGMGGNAGEPSGDAGMGGEGGAPPALTLAQSCANICAAEAGLSCAIATCEAECEGNSAFVDDLAVYTAMIVCEGENLTAANYECSNMDPAPATPAPKGGTTCESKICAWTCSDMSGLIDANVAARCGCPVT